MRYPNVVLTVALLFTLSGLAVRAEAEPGNCAALLELADLTLIRAQTRTTEAGNGYCYARGLGPRAIAWHTSLPDAWNGRLVYLGDGGQDGDLDEAPFLVDAGYAVVNSNMGHDDGIEGQAFGFDDPASEIDFAWRAQHLALNAAKRLIGAHYGEPHHHAYHFGCSTGGRQGLLAAQMLPDDYDGIVAGAPGHLWYPRMAHRVALMQTLFADGMAANPAFDADGDGVPENLGKIDLLARRATEACDAADGIEDGIIEPALCPLDARTLLSGMRCEADRDADDCFTEAQVAALVQLYEGSRNSRGEIVYPGAPLGSELQWPAVFIPHAGNDLTPYALISGAQVIGYRFFATDPGLMPPDLAATDRLLVAGTAGVAQWGWWQFDLNDLDDPDRRTPVFDLMQGDEADLRPFLLDRGGKLLMFHGLADAVIPPEPTLDYFDAVVETTFAGDAGRAVDHVRLYGVPGMAHCRGGAGPQPDYADWLTALVAWVEDGRRPETITARTLEDGRLTNERPLCPYPARAVYTGPAGTQHDPANWREHNFTCR
ncbi:MAG: tannase/feruloyl esterase family alpha/beta hydrolase [Pseudomonadales bacterium]